VRFFSNERVDLHLQQSLGDNYTRQSQKIRVLTESWVKNEILCPTCSSEMCDYPNNKPVADFFCPICRDDYELKSKKYALGTKIVDGAYDTMIKRLNSNSNPHFFFLHYEAKHYRVINFLIIPKHFFTPDIIEKRNPLAPNARRAGWVGCNILMDTIPESGKVFYIKNGYKEPADKISSRWQESLFLQDIKITSKGWLLDIMRCIDKLGKGQFLLDEIYKFAPELGKKHPQNNHIHDKIRQQLQILRDKGYLDFISRGVYQKR